MTAKRGGKAGWPGDGGGGPGLGGCWLRKFLPGKESDWGRGPGTGFTMETIPGQDIVFSCIKLVDDYLGYSGFVWRLPTQADVSKPILFSLWAYHLSATVPPIVYEVATWHAPTGQPFVSTPMPPGGPGPAPPFALHAFNNTTPNVVLTSSIPTVPDSGGAYPLAAGDSMYSVVYRGDDGQGDNFLLCGASISGACV